MYKNNKIQSNPSPQGINLKGDCNSNTEFISNNSDDDPHSHNDYYKDASFMYCIKLTLINEGGFVDHPNDPGGATKYGISKRSYPDLDIQNLTIDEAMRIYYRDFWDGKLCSELKNIALAFKLFDMSVNMGEKRAEVIFKRALRAIGFSKDEDDYAVLSGIDKEYIKNIKDNCLDNIIARVLLFVISSEVAGYYRSLISGNKDYSVFRRGWLKRAYMDINCGGIDI